MVNAIPIGGPSGSSHVINTALANMTANKLLLLQNQQTSALQLEGCDRTLGGEDRITHFMINTHSAEPTHLVGVVLANLDVNEPQHLTTAMHGYNYGNGAYESTLSDYPELSQQDNTHLTLLNVAAAGSYQTNPAHVVVCDERGRPALCKTAGFGSYAPLVAESEVTSKDPTCLGVVDRDGEIHRPACQRVNVKLLSPRCNDFGGTAVSVTGEGRLSRAVS